jgi:hypothetical protein
MRKLIFIFLTLVIAFPQRVVAQALKHPPDLLLDRARSLTDDLVGDARELSPFDRALLWARLGAAWYQDDMERSRAWMRGAVEEVSAPSGKEDAAARRTRLATLRALLSIVGQHDAKLLDSLKNSLTAAAESTGRAERGADAKALVEVALSLLDKDPGRAAGLGSAALRMGGTHKLANLLWRLRKHDVRLGDALFLEVLAAARARDFDTELLSLLPQVAFEGPVPSERLRRELLGVLAQGLLRPSNSAAEKAAACRLAPLAAPLLPEFQRLLPQRSGMVRNETIVCQLQLDSGARAEVADSLRNEPLKTIDDFEKAARGTSDRERRMSYLSRAASLAAEGREYDRAVAILDGFDGELRDFMNARMGGLWDSLRLEYAAEAAIAHFKRSDASTMRRVIADTPTHLRPVVQISVARELIQKEEELPAALELIEAGRSGLAATRPEWVVDSCFALMHDHARLNPTDTLAILHEGVKALNQTGETGTGVGTAEISLFSSEILLARYSLPASLLAMNELGVREEIAFIASPAQRAAVRLQLLNSLMRQRQAHPPSRPAVIEGKENAAR